MRMRMRMRFIIAAKEQMESANGYSSAKQITAGALGVNKEQSKPNFILSEKMINTLWTQVKNGYCYDSLLQSVLRHEAELAKSADLFPAAIVILSMVKNNIVEANLVTDEHFKQVLTDLAQKHKEVGDIEHSLEQSSQPYFMEMLNNGNPNFCLNLLQQGIAYLTKQPLGPMYSDTYSQHELLVPYDLLCSVNDELERRDALNLSLTCKNFYVSLGSTLDIHNWTFESVEDGEKFKAADELIRRTNKKLPDPKKSLVDFEKITRDADEAKTAFFEYLVTDCVDLYLYLRKNPQLINEQDKYQSTLLHYAAKFIRRKDSILTQQLLFSVPGIDLNIKDCADTTAFQRALFYPDGQETSFQYFANEAVSRGFDWSTKGNLGWTILHKAVGADGYSQSLNTNLAILLNVMNKYQVPNQASIFDALCDEGQTALYTCISCGYSDAALRLVNAGANPEACGEDGKHNPLKRMAKNKIDSKKYKTYERWNSLWGPLEKILGDKLTPYIEAAESKPEKDDNCIIS